MPTQGEPPPDTYSDLIDITYTAHAGGKHYSAAAVAKHVNPPVELVRLTGKTATEAHDAVQSWLDQYTATKLEAKARKLSRKIA